MKRDLQYSEKENGKILRVWVEIKFAHMRRVEFESKDNDYDNANS